jgi:hypothetical protein
MSCERANVHGGTYVEGGYADVFAHRRRPIRGAGRFGQAGIRRTQFRHHLTMMSIGDQRPAREGASMRPSSLRLIIIASTDAAWAH